MMNFEIICSGVIFLLPAIYMSIYKPYVVIPNKRYDCFLTRFIFICPYLFAITLACYVLMTVPFNPISSKPYYVGWIVKLAAAIFVILWYRLFILKRGIPQEHDPLFLNHELYLYAPSFIFGRYMFRNPENPDFYDGHSKITVKLVELHKKIYFENHGELIVHKSALDIFEKNGLEGYFVIPVCDSSTKKESKDYFQVIVNHIMPEYSPQTTLKAGNSLDRLMFDGSIYYNRSVLSECGDFNRSYENIDSYAAVNYGSQHYWILSNKTVRVFVEELGQPKRDFQPVYLIDDQNE